MPKYKIQLKQGKRTIVAHGEFKSVAHCKAHYEAISTMKVTEILKIEYEYTGDVIPQDDFQYRSLYKGYIKNEGVRKSKQVIFNNIKLSVNENDIKNSCVQNMEIDGVSVESLTSSLFKT